MKKLRKIIVTSICVALPLGFSVSPNSAYASESVNSEISITQNAFTDAEMKQIEKDLELLFTRYVVENENGHFEVIYDNVSADGAEHGLKHFEDIAYVLNSENPVRSGGNQINTMSALGAATQPQGVMEFAGCVLFHGLGGDIIANAPGLIADTKDAIRAWKWGLAARTVARIIGPAAVKTLGGPWGIAASLALAAPGCTNKL